MLFLGSRRFADARLGRGRAVSNRAHPSPSMNRGVPGCKLGQARAGKPRQARQAQPGSPACRIPHRVKPMIALEARKSIALFDRYDGQHESLRAAQHGDVRCVIDTRCVERAL
jgi:hypothetical protein